MSAYAESVLADGERIVYRAVISRWGYFQYYLFGGLFVLGGAAQMLMDSERWPAFLRTFGVAAMIVGLLIVAAAVIHRRTTELVLTDRRIIVKHGLVSRVTLEMNLSKVETIRVHQGLLGRILNFGDVTVIGTGSTLEPLKGIADPVSLRQKLGEVLQTKGT